MARDEILEIMETAGSCRFQRHSRMPAAGHMDAEWVGARVSVPGSKPKSMRDLDFQNIELRKRVHVFYTFEMI